MLGLPETFLRPASVFKCRPASIFYGQSPAPAPKSRIKPLWTPRKSFWKNKNTSSGVCGQCVTVVCNVEP